MKRNDVILILILSISTSFVLVIYYSCFASDATPTPVVTQAVTPQPTPKPTPAPSVKQKIEDAIQNDAGAVAFCYIVDTKSSIVEVAGQMVTITEDASKAPIIDNDRAKECIFYAEKMHGQAELHHISNRSLRGAVTRPVREAVYRRSGEGYAQ